MLFDFHVHSNISLDSDESMEATIDMATRRGLTGLCFTDHCDLVDYFTYTSYPGERKLDCFDTWSRSYAAIAQARAWAREIGLTIEILHGIELGDIVQEPEWAREIAASPDLDCVLGSVHAVMGSTEFSLIDFPDVSGCKQQMSDYLDEILRMVRYDLTDLVSHIGYPNRYMARQGFSVDMTEFTEQLRAIFEVVIQNGRGIEVNTSGLRQGAGITFPDLPTLKLYREMGGEIITLGSDAHRAENVGDNFADAVEMLQTAGFRYTSVFRRRKAEFVRL